MHRTVDSLNFSEKRIIKKAYKAIVKKEEASAVLESTYVGTRFEKSIYSTWKEFFTYIIMGDIYKPKVEERLQKEFPKAYLLYTTLRDRINKHKYLTD